MRVIIISNVHYHYFAALKAYQDGCLEKYIRGIAAHENSVLFRLLPWEIRRKLLARRCNGVDTKTIGELWLPEFVSYCLPLVRVTSSDRAIHLGNRLFELLSLRFLHNCDLLHYTTTIGLSYAKRAKRMGAKILCEERAIHPTEHYEILAQEYDLMGLRFDAPGIMDVNRTLLEYEVSDAFLVPSHFARESFIKVGIKSDRIFTVPYGVDTELFRPTDSNKPDDGIFRILFVGRIYPGKGVHYLIEAFKRLSLPNTQLVLVGPIHDSMEQYIQRSANMSVNVITKGNVSVEELVELYNNSDVFVLPSLADSFSLVALEAMACGLPIIITENTGAKDILEDGFDGYVIPVRNVEAVQERIEMLYVDRDLRMAIGERARKKSLKYTWQLYGCNVFNVYRSILEGQC